MNIRSITAVLVLGMVQQNVPRQYVLNPCNAGSCAQTTPQKGVAKPEDVVPNQLIVMDAAGNPLISALWLSPWQCQSTANDPVNPTNVVLTCNKTQ